MAFAGKDVLEDKKTGYTFKNLPILLSKTRGRPPSGKMAVGKYGWWSEKKRIEALTVFAALGQYNRVEELTGVPANTVRQWLKEQWARDLLDEIRSENDHAIDAKFTEIVTTALKGLSERLENGDSKVLRDGSLVKVPVGAKDLAIITAINVDKRQLLRGKPTTRSEQITEGSRLQRLEQMFLKLAKPVERKVVEIHDVEFEEVVVDEPAKAVG